MLKRTDTEPENDPKHIPWQGASIPMSTPRWVLIKRASELTGYSEDAIRHKVKNGTWAQGRIWRKARDNRVFINIEELDRWVESSPQEAA